MVPFAPWYGVRSMTDEPTRQPDPSDVADEVPALIPQDPGPVDESPEPESDGGARAPSGPDTTEEAVQNSAALTAASAAAEPATAFDPAHLPKLLWRIVKEPEGGLADAHQRGRAALLYGLCFAGLAIVFLGFSSEIHQGDRFDLMRSILGGIGFVAATGLSSLLLRALAGRVSRLEWVDDFYLVGGALAYPLAAGVLSLLLGFVPGLGVVAGFVGLTGCVLGTYAFKEGLISVGQVDERRAVWLATVALAAGATIGSALSFYPFVLV